jgi:hypothetical protein
MKRALSFTVVFAGLAVISLFAVTGRGQDRHDRGGADEDRVRRGFAIAPVPLRFERRHRDLVGLGSYIVNAQFPVSPPSPSRRRSFSAPLAWAG